METKNSAGVCAGDFIQPFLASIRVMRSYQMVAASLGDFSGRAARRRLRSPRHTRFAFAPSISRNATIAAETLHLPGDSEILSDNLRAVVNNASCCRRAQLRTRWNH